MNSPGAGPNERESMSADPNRSGTASSSGELERVPLGTTGVGCLSLRKGEMSLATAVASASG
jgi:hypothetical protein